MVQNSISLAGRRGFNGIPLPLTDITARVIIRRLQAVGDITPLFAAPCISLSILFPSFRNRRKSIPTNDIVLAADDDREGDAVAWHIGNAPFECPVAKIRAGSTQRYALRYALTYVSKVWP